MDWIISFASIWAMILFGRRDRWGWILKIVAGVAGLMLNLQFQLWGMMPLGVIGIAVCVKNFLAWGVCNSKKSGLP